MRIAWHTLVAAALAGALSMPGTHVSCAEAAGDTARAPDASLLGPPTPWRRDIEVDGIFGHMALSHVEIIDGRLDAPALARTLDPPSAADAPRLLQAMTARIIRIGTITIGVPGSIPNWRLQNVQIERPERGRIAVLSVGQLTLAGRGATSLTLTDVAADALDLRLLAQSLTEMRKEADEPLSPLCGTFGFRVTAQLPDGTLNARMTGGGIRARPLIVPGDQPSQSPDAEGGKRKWRRLADAVDSVAVDRVEIADLVFRAAKSRNVFQVARMRTGGIGRGTVAELAVDGVSFVDKDAAVTFEHFALTNVRFRDALTTLATLGGKDVNPQALKPFVEEMELRRLAVASTGKGDRFGFDRFLINGSKWDDPGPSRRRMSLDRLFWTWPAASQDPLAVRLASLGYRSLDASAMLEWLLDEKETLRVDVSARSAGMGRLALHTELDHFSADVGDPHRSVALAALLKIRLQRLALRYDDDGLAARLLAHDPVLSKTTAQQRRTQAREAMQAVLRPLTLADLPPNVSPLSEAIEAFAADPRSLDVSLFAAGGIGMTEVPLLKSPRELLRRLQVTATVDR